MVSLCAVLCLCVWRRKTEFVRHIYIYTHIIWARRTPAKNNELFIRQNPIIILIYCHCYYHIVFGAYIYIHIQIYLYERKYG